MNGAALLLAAGTGRRFGSDKRRAQTASGQTLLCATINCYRALGWPIFVVIREGERILAERVTQELRGQAPAVELHWVEAPEAALGMGHSLSAGVTALMAHGHDRALIGLGDMPYLMPSTLERLQQALIEAKDPGCIVRPRHSGCAGNPVGFGAELLQELASCLGDSGARAVVQQHAAAIRWLDVDDPGVLQDVDRPVDLASS